MPKSLFRRLTKSFFIVANIIVAALFVAGCCSKWFDPEPWWILGLLNVSAFYFLTVLVLFIIFWLFVNPRLVIISVITIIATWQFVTNIVAFRLPNTFAIQKNKNATRVMSWNVAQFDVLNFPKTHKVFYQMTDMINENDPDIACFQEVVCSDSLGKSHLKLDTLLGRLKFNYHHYSYENSENWFGLNMHFGTLILSKYPIIKQEAISHAPFNYNSSFQYCDIVKNSDTIRVFNIHLQSLKFTKNNYRYIDESIENKAKNIDESKSILSKMRSGFINRKKQADWIRAEMDKSPYPIIVCGDFNDLPNSYAYDRIGNGLQNAFAKKGTGIGRTFSGIAPNLRIDNIFVDKKYEILQFTRIARKLSDHFPIITDISSAE